MKPNVLNSFIFVSLLIIVGCKNDPQTTFSNPYEHLASLNPDTLTYEQLYNRTLSLWDTPFDEKDIQTSKGIAHVIISGPEDGEPVVLFHGMNSSSTVWYPNINALSSSFRVYAIDCILETNKSKLEGELNDTKAIVDWYYEVFDKLGLDQFSLIGASMGGWLAVNVALDAPERIQHLILLSPAQTFIMVPPSDKMLKNMLYSNDRDKLRKMLQTITYDVDQLDQLYIDQYYKGLTIENPENLMLKMMPFSKEEFARLQMPVMVLIGDDDFINNDRSIDIAKDHIPNVTTKKLHARHFITIDQTKKVNALITEFISKTPKKTYK